MITELNRLRVLAIFGVQSNIVGAVVINRRLADMRGSAGILSDGFMRG